MDNNEFSTIERRLVAFAGFNKSPIGGSIEITPLCTLHCNMCYVHLYRDEMKQCGTPLTLDRWKELFKEMKDEGVLFLTVTGGEPLLHPQFKEIYKCLHDMGMVVTLNTNATLIDESWIAFFKDYCPRRINVTLYGASSNTYEKLCHNRSGFEKAVNGIRMLHDAGFDVKINGSIVRSNVDEWEEMMNICDDIGVIARFDTYMYPSRRESLKPFPFDERLDPITAARAQLAMFKREMNEEEFATYVIQSVMEVENIEEDDYVQRGTTCRGGTCFFTLTWKGMLTTCIVSNDPGVSVVNNNFLDSWNELVEKTEKLEKSIECTKCRYRKFCNTCVMAEYYEEGSYGKTPQYLCALTKEKYRIVKEYFDKNVRMVEM